MRFLPVFVGLVLVSCTGETFAARNNRQDVRQAFQPLKAISTKQQRTKQVAGRDTEEFLSLQSQLILSQEPYVQQTIDEEHNIRDSLETVRDAKCAGFVSTATDALMTLGGISFGNCVAKIDKDMFLGLYSSATSADDSTARQEYARTSLLSDWGRMNIFTEAAAINTMIEEKLMISSESERLFATRELSTALKDALQECLVNARALLSQSLSAATSQVDNICDQ
ncbi:uncharacterized protein LOC128270734 [Anopheles cruzii]|uniref:uncharacterized protein LOC128270734 n=1 Tax=Anopheles cruzii TaxID=68878 RepID=UPI0022EC6AFE|nr:uncharacterized protein LOC128270734 [Anopheles cruzii]